MQPARLAARARIPRVAVTLKDRQRSREVPTWVTIVSLWSSLEGSILFWGLILGAYIAGATWLTGVHPKKTQGTDIHVGISADQVAAREMAKTTHQKEYASLLQLAATPVTFDQKDDRSPDLFRLAFLYLLSHDPVHARVALQYVEQVVTRQLHASRRVRARRKTR